MGSVLVRFNRADGNEGRSWRRPAAEPGIDWSQKARGGGEWRIMHGAANFHGIETGRPHDGAQIARRAELRRPPDGRTEPGADAPPRGESIPLAKLADHQPPIRLEHARHFRDRLPGIGGKAQQRHRDHAVECRLGEWQFLGAPFDQCKATGPKRRALARGSKHSGIGVETDNLRAAADHFRSEGPVAATDVEKSLAGDGAEKFEDEIALQRIGDPAEAARPPARIRLNELPAR